MSYKKIELIKAHLDRACELDGTARANRAEAGRLLAQLRSESKFATGNAWFQQCNLDQRCAEILISMAVGSDLEKKYEQ